MNESKNDVTSATDRTIVTPRVIDAPRELVFKAWTDPDHLVHWWGPKGFTNTFHEFDLKPGGVWRFVVHGPDGDDYNNQSVFVEIVRPERIVFQHVSAPQFLVTVTLAEQAGKTKFTWSMLFESVTAGMHQVSIIDTTTHEVTNVVVGGGPRGVAITPF